MGHKPDPGANGAIGGKGDGKGPKAKKKAKAQVAKGLKGVTDDGRAICYRFQRGKCKFGKGCRMLHVCQRCQGDHSLKDCSIYTAE